jgi:hypothetical protein
MDAYELRGAWRSHFAISGTSSIRGPRPANDLQLERRLIACAAALECSERNGVGSWLGHRPQLHAAQGAFARPGLDAATHGRIVETRLTRFRGVEAGLDDDDVQRTTSAALALPKEWPPVVPRLRGLAAPRRGTLPPLREVPTQIAALVVSSFDHPRAGCQTGS